MSPREFLLQSALASLCSRRQLCREQVLDWPCALQQRQGEQRQPNTKLWHDLPSGRLQIQTKRWTLLQRGGTQTCWRVSEAAFSWLSFMGSKLVSHAKREPSLQNPPAKPLP